MSSIALVGPLPQPERMGYLTKIASYRKGRELVSTLEGGLLWHVYP
jgi:hypothetical protein